MSQTSPLLQVGTRTTSPPANNHLHIFVEMVTVRGFPRFPFTNHELDFHSSPRFPVFADYELAKLTLLTTIEGASPLVTVRLLRPFSVCMPAVQTHYLQITSLYGHCRFHLCPRCPVFADYELAKLTLLTIIREP
jgi:hypothetical protein